MNKLSDLILAARDHPDPVLAMSVMVGIGQVMDSDQVSHTSKITVELLERIKSRIEVLMADREWKKDRADDRRQSFEMLFSLYAPYPGKYSQSDDPIRDAKLYIEQLIKETSEVKV